MESNFESNTDECEAEAEWIVIGLHRASSGDDVHTLVYDVFLYWFDATTADPFERYREIAIAKDIWGLHTEFQS